MKKLLAFLICLFPFAAMAGDEVRPIEDWEIWEINQAAYQYGRYAGWLVACDVYTPNIVYNSVKQNMIRNLRNFDYNTYKPWYDRGYINGFRNGLQPGDTCDDLYEMFHIPDRARGVDP